MTANVPTGFFAYPSEPRFIGETIHHAIENINQSAVARIRPWDDSKIGGKLVVDEICKDISRADFFCADLTGINPNVMFELGYAIARNKRIWLTIDPSVVDAKSNFDKLRILTTVGYSRYTNSQEIEAALYADQPYADLDSTLFRQAIEPNLLTDPRETVLYLKSFHNTDASIRITKRIESAKFPLIVDDPRESAIQPLTWYGVQVYSALGLVCHLNSPNREGVRLYNARYALVAGMAFALGKQLLMLAEEGFLAPIDYRDLLRTYWNTKEAVGHLETWLAPIEQILEQNRRSQHTYAQTVQLATELKALQLGEPIAENEAEQLVEGYFVETASYREAYDGKHTIFVGRKGSGKTATFLKLAAELDKDARNLVCVIKPAAYELEGLVELLTRYKERDAKGYVLESLWKYLIYTEIANAAAEIIQSRPSGQFSADEDALLRLLDRDDASMRQDFSVRLERCVQDLLDRSLEAKQGEVEQFRVAISETLHAGTLRELRTLLQRVLGNRQRVAILIDNLDKAWDKQAQVGSLSEFLLGLLGVANRIPQELKVDGSRRKPVRVSVALFLRSDIFYKVMETAREPDKINHTRLTWQDPQLLLRVIEERFQAAHGDDTSPERLWERYFTRTVKGSPTKEYLTRQIIARPRDLVVFVKAAIATAVNRRHASVEEGDVLEAEKQYSLYALESILVENGVVARSLSDIIYEFVGATAIMSYEEVRRCVVRARVPEEQVDQVIDHLCALTFLGVEVRADDFRFAEDPSEHRKDLVLARKFRETGGAEPRYMINRAFWAFLEVVRGEEGHLFGTGERS